MMEGEVEATKRRLDQMDRLTRLLHEMCGEVRGVNDLEVLAGVLADTLVAVYALRKADVSADECVASMKASLKP